MRRLVKGEATPHLHIFKINEQEIWKACVLGPLLWREVKLDPEYNAVTFELDCRSLHWH